jgi:hypothetical protein
MCRHLIFLVGLSFLGPFGLAVASLRIIVHYSWAYIRILWNRGTEDAVFATRIMNSGDRTIGRGFFL